MYSLAVAVAVAVAVVLAVVLVDIVVLVDTVDRLQDNCYNLAVDILVDNFAVGYSLAFHL